MTSERDKQRQHEQRELKRRSVARQARASETQKQQAQAAARREFESRRKRHAAAYALFVVAAIIAVSHVFEHAGVIRPMPLPVADILIGWPMAGFLAVVGGIVYGV